MPRHIIELIRHGSTGTPSDDLHVAVDAEHVAVVFGSLQEADKSVVRMSDGRGFAVQGAYSSIRAFFPGLVEFIRHDAAEFGEDDNTDAYIAVNPNTVCAVLQTGELNKSIIRLGDGRGFSLRSPYDVTMRRLGFSSVPLLEGPAATAVGSDSVN